MIYYQCPACGSNSTAEQGHHCIEGKFIWGTDLKLYYQFKLWDQCPTGVTSNLPTRSSS